MQGEMCLGRLCGQSCILIHSDLFVISSNCKELFLSIKLECTDQACSGGVWRHPAAKLVAKMLASILGGMDRRIIRVITSYGSHSLIVGIFGKSFELSGEEIKLRILRGGVRFTQYVVCFHVVKCGINKISVLQIF